MIKRIKNLISNFSKQEEDKEEDKISSLDKACSALLIEVAYADKVFDESEIISYSINLSLFSFLHRIFSNFRYAHHPSHNFFYPQSRRMECPLRNHCIIP